MVPFPGSGAGAGRGGEEHMPEEMTVLFRKGDQGFAASLNLSVLAKGRAANGGCIGVARGKGNSGVAWRYGGQRIFENRIVFDDRPGPSHPHAPGKKTSLRASHGGRSSRVRLMSLRFLASHLKLQRSTLFVGISSYFDFMFGPGNHVNLF